MTQNHNCFYLGKFDQCFHNDGVCQYRLLSHQPEQMFCGKDQMIALSGSDKEQ